MLKALAIAVVSDKSDRSDGIPGLGIALYDHLLERLYSERNRIERDVLGIASTFRTMTVKVRDNFTKVQGIFGKGCEINEEAKRSGLNQQSLCDLGCKTAYPTPAFLSQFSCYYTIHSCSKKFTLKNINRQACQARGTCARTFRCLTLLFSNTPALSSNRI